MGRFRRNCTDPKCSRDRVPASSAECSSAVMGGVTRMTPLCHLPHIGPPLCGGALRRIMPMRGFTRLLLAGVCAAACSPALQAQADNDRSINVQHVLLISIDGMHALDFINCSKGI